jgi:hypothetical protein
VLAQVARTSAVARAAVTVVRVAHTSQALVAMHLALVRRRLAAAIQLAVVALTNSL